MPAVTGPSRIHGCSYVRALGSPKDRARSRSDYEWPGERRSPRQIAPPLSLTGACRCVLVCPPDARLRAPLDTGGKQMSQGTLAGHSGYVGMAACRHLRADESSRPATPVTILQDPRWWIGLLPRAKRPAGSRASHAPEGDAIAHAPRLPTVDNADTAHRRAIATTHSQCRRSP